MISLGVDFDIVSNQLEIMQAAGFGHIDVKYLMVQTQYWLFDSMFTNYFDLMIEYFGCIHLGFHSSYSFSKCSLMLTSIVPIESSTG